MDRFTFLRIDRPGAGGFPVSECSLLDDTELPGDRVPLSSFITGGLSALQADRLEEFFRRAGCEIRRAVEVKQEEAKRNQMPPKVKQTPAKSPPVTCQHLFSGQTQGHEADHVEGEIV